MMQILDNNTATITMSTVDIAELTGKRHDNVMRKAKELADKGIINATQIEERYNNNNIRMVYHLNKTESLNLVANLSPEFTARIIDRWQALENQTALPQDYPTALRAYADEVEKRITAEQEARYAIETKAWISSKREATSMATASVATRKVNQLEKELDKSKEYATIKRMQLQYHGLTFSWRELKQASQELGLPPTDVFDANYGTVKAYHKDVWLEVYALNTSLDDFNSKEAIA